MKTKLISTIIAVLMFLTGCTQNTGDIQLSEEYFPLQIGNKWYYESTLGYSHTIEIIDTARINGQLYFKIERKDDRGRTGSYYARYTNEKIYQKFNESEEILFIDLAAPFNESYTAHQGHIQTLVTRKTIHDKITISGNEFENVIESYHQLPDQNNYTSYYARGIGVVSLIWDRENQEVKLVRARIDGKTVFR